MTFRFTLMLLLVTYGVSARNSLAETQTVLLVDDSAILYRPGTYRRIHPLKRYSPEPLIRADQPWEGLLSYCTLYHDPDTGEYKIWYQSHGGGCNVCYAVSTDGIHWTKPLFTIYPYRQSGTNIVLKTPRGYGASVCVEREPGPRRYKMAYWDMPNEYEFPFPGLYAAFSEDGIHWNRHEDGPLLKGAYGKSTEVPYADDPGYGWGVPCSVSDVIDLTYIPDQKKYVIFAKSWIDGPDGKTYWKRAITRTESDDFITWRRPELVMYPDEDDGQFPAASGGSRQGVQLHGGPAFCYQGTWFSLLQVIDFETSGEMPIELALSRDGRTWSRPFRKELFLDVSHGGRFDGGRLWSSSTPILLKDEFRFYYGAYSTVWNSTTKTLSGIGLATLPRDRFAGIRPLYEEGQITFKPHSLRGCSRIGVNANASVGFVACELLDTSRRRIRGFAAEDCATLTGDSLDHTVSWKNTDLSVLPAGDYILRLYLRNAEVYAVTFQE